MRRPWLTEAQLSVTRVDCLDIGQQVRDFTIGEETQRQHFRQGDAVEDFMQRLFGPIARDPTER